MGSRSRHGVAAVGPLAAPLEPPPVVLVASDLHLGEGRDAETGMYTVRENFFADDAFRRWLAHYGPVARQGALLVLDGDTFDFLRIVRCPSTRADYAEWAARLPLDQQARATAANVSRHERVFGLRTDGYKAVWKLHVIIRGHPAVFDALAEWVGAGGWLVVVKGNHDLELHWSEVTTALVNEIAERVGTLAAGDAAAAAERVRFSEDGFLLANLRVEHGHQYEAMTAVVGEAELNATGQLNLPLGSFINRYFINALERLDPFLDNVKPSTQALLAVLRGRPLAVWRTYWRAWRFVWRALRVRKPWGAVAPVLAVVAGLVVPPLVLALVALRFLRPDLVAWIPPWLRIPGSIAGLSFPMLLPYALAVLRELGREFGLFRPGDELRDGAAEALGPGIGSYPRVYAVMGHTHEQGAWRVSSAGRTALYVNTGTWIALWPLDRKDLAGRVFSSFARFSWTGPAGYVHESLVWDDEAGEPRPARLLAAEED